MLEDSVGYVRLKVFLENKDALRDSASLVRVRLEQLAHAGPILRVRPAGQPWRKWC